jgi:hypothetical protein
VSNNHPPISIQAGETCEGFTARRVTPLKNLRAVAYEMAHRRTGAKLLHVHAQDAENLFCIAFPTPPEDDTGLPHILEHAVLGGSRKYPVKDPFVEMVKMSMATFINAMTASDHTMYPVASNVRQDFYNLAEVYWDAVFHPRLARTTFQQEGHHLELARRDDLASDLLIKGIVYNEMKGAYSSADAIVARFCFRGLFPDTPYGRDSGGDPERIPELTYQDFKFFHREHYHPSNAHIFIYGDIPTPDHLVFLKSRLKAYASRPVAFNMPRQPRWTEERVRQESYPVGKTDDLSKKTYLTLSWVVGDGTDGMDVLAFSLLELILLGHHGAPLRKALIDSKLGEDLTHSGFSSGRLESTFSVGLKGSEPGRREQFVKLVLETLARIADEGIPRERIETAFQQIAYHYLEIESMFPLWLMSRALWTWLYGADPLTFLRADELLADLRRRIEAEPAMFSGLIRERLLNNPHRLSLECVPDRELQGRKDAAFSARMAQLKSGLPKRKLERVAEEADELERLQSRPNPPEALATLPQLKVSDLPPKPKHIPTTVEQPGGGVTFLRNDVFANGVNYLHLDLNLAGLPEELFPSLPLYGDCVRKMGAAGLDYVKTAERIAAHTGGVGFYAQCHAHAAQEQISLRRAGFTLKALDGRLDQALGVLHDLLYELDLRDTARLKEVVVQARAANRSSIPWRGVPLAMRHAARGLSLESHLQEILYGLPQVRSIEELAGSFDSQQDQLVARLEAIRQYIRDHGVLTASFTGTPAEGDRIARCLAGWMNERRSAAAAERPVSFRPGAAPPREGLAFPMEVAYCTHVFPAPHLSSPDAPLLMVASHLLSLGYFWEEVRIKGGAYGGGCGYNGLERNWYLYSYRDPWVKRTLDIFGALLSHVRTADWTRADIDRAIIGTAKEGERPIRPGAATGTALWRCVAGETRELREARHAAILRATPAEVKRAVLEMLERDYARGGTCVVSSREKLEQGNREMPGAGLAIEDILK